MTGLPKLLVKTLHSSYVIDQEAKTFKRTPEHANANFLPEVSGAFRPYEELFLKEGESLSIVLPNEHWLRSTAVQSITEIAE